MRALATKLLLATALIYGAAAPAWADSDVYRTRFLGHKFVSSGGPE